MSWRVMVLGTIALVSCKQLGPEVKTYDDCILQYLKAGMDDIAVIAITKSCKAKFPPGSHRPPGTRDLTPSELAAITGRAGMGSGGGSGGGNYAGSLYNGTMHLLLTDVWINITTTVGGATTSRLYHDDVLIPPQQAGTFGLTVIVADEGAEYAWSIARAMGRPSQ